MATKTKKTDGISNVKGNAALVTGLGETIEQIETLTGEKARALVHIAKQGGKANVNDLMEAAYQYGLCERRRRKLARKVGAATKAEE